MSTVSDVAVPSPAVYDVEVVAKATRRRFTAAYKRKILRAADACTQPGAIGVLLRREGLYSSHLDKWRKQRAQEQLGAQKRGRKADPQAAEVTRLRQENERLQARLQQAETIIAVQKKLSELLGLTPDGTRGRAQP